jgi:hypothetical protein
MAAMLIVAISSISETPCWVFLMGAQSAHRPATAPFGPTNGCPPPISGARV